MFDWRFHARKRRAYHGGRTHEIGLALSISWNVGIADSDFHPLEPAQRSSMPRRWPLFKDRPPRPKSAHMPVIADNV
jgi:hypothetical protein